MSRRKKKVFQFTLGQGSVIQAWESAVGTMQVGEMIELKAAPEFCYGTQGMPPAIPPNATLTFEIELLEFYAPSIIEFLVKNGVRHPPAPAPVAPLQLAATASASSPVAPCAHPPPLRLPPVLPGTHARRPLLPLIIRRRTSSRRRPSRPLPAAPS